MSGKPVFLLRGHLPYRQVVPSEKERERDRNFFQALAASMGITSSLTGAAANFFHSLSSSSSEKRSGASAGEGGGFSPLILPEGGPSQRRSDSSPFRERIFSIWTNFTQLFSATTFCCSFPLQFFFVLKAGSRFFGQVGPPAGSAQESRPPSTGVA